MHALIALYALPASVFHAIHAGEYFRKTRSARAGVTETRHVTRTASVGIIDTDYQINIATRSALGLIQPVVSPFDRQSSAQVEFKRNQPYKLPPETNSDIDSVFISTTEKTTTSVYAGEACARHLRARPDVRHKRDAGGT
ncbi:hypothetical protein [Burkholderia cepacia]|uniref:hypothetical protein n=1 Tax=Burkholderia cepacia TaxID=292 RepID=UPI001CF3D8CE|nr:hypothetical protein [Burkholderia cepacia]MCA8352265.1 hypothetical protein [Burkholderia cepacia]